MYHIAKRLPDEEHEMSYSQVKKPTGKSKPLQVRNPKGLSAPGRLRNPSEPQRATLFRTKWFKGPRPGSMVQGVGQKVPMPPRFHPPYAEERPGGSNPPSLASHVT